ncbi:MAG: class I SAM-dependent rRNA methyltransferase [Bacteroidetes bacterium]|nr:class I SAM-dependent rRNA methyltransferase [Bacteroidota bacterium]
MAKIILKSGKDDAVRRFHPWVFSGAIKKIEGNVDDGDIVEVYSNHDEYLATGHYQNGTIMVRLFSFKQIIPDNDFWKSKIQKAYDLRKLVGLVDNENTNVYRLVHAEGDGLPGLIIDFYNGTAVIQTHSIGMHMIKDQLIKALTEVYGDKLKAVFDKSSETMPKQSSIKPPDSYIFGGSSETVVLENDSKFHVEWEGGQKTGFFIDQRENRDLLKKYSKGKTVLNTFCYTGGFSVTALKAGAKLVHSVDSSKKAIDLTDRNIELNNFTEKQHQSIAADVIDYLKDIDNKYEVIILDPPAFAKHQDAKHHAVQGYKRLNAQAIKQIKPGGILFTFSCSQVVDKNLFSSTVVSAAIQVGRNVKILHRLSQPPDHPVSAFHPEGEYLKGLVLFVE